MKRKVVFILIFMFVFSFCFNIDLVKSKSFSIYASGDSFQQFQEEFSKLVAEDEFETFFIEENSNLNDLVSKINGTEFQLSPYSEFNDGCEEIVDDENIAEVCEGLDLAYSETDNGYEVYSKYKYKRIIVTGSVTNNYGAEKVLTYKNYNILTYTTEEETKYAYENLQKDDSLIVVLDGRVELTNSTQLQSIDYDYSQHRNRWGTEAIDLGYYSEYLETNNSNEEVVVAVIDTGIRATHSEFTDRILEDSSGNLVGYTYSTSATGYFYNDGEGHGTHVSGIITDMTPSNVKILPMKVFSDAGDGLLSYVTTALTALASDSYSNYNIVAANLSLGNADTLSASDLKSLTDEFTACFTKIRNKGIIPVVAAGNEKQNTSQCVPAVCENAITVSALYGPNLYTYNSSTEKYELTIGSSQVYSGEYKFESGYSNYGSAVDISAPGTGILSAYNRSDSDVVWMAGTSQAAPHVAAAIALLSIDKMQPDASITDIENRLYNSAIDLGATGKDVYYGNGMLNLQYFNGNINYTATDKVVTYDGSYHNITLEVSGVDDYTIYYGLSSSNCVITDISTVDAFKNYTNGAMNVYFKIVAENYVDTLGTATLTINKASISITTLDQTGVYGDIILNKVEGVNYTISGTVYGNDDLGVVLTTTASNTKDVGKYDIDATITNSNYSLSVTKGKFEITPRPVTIELNRQYSTYGEDISLSTTAYTVVSNSIVSGDSLLLDLYTEATNNSPVGEYEIVKRGENPNYSVTANTGTLEITARKIKVQASKSSVYGDEIDLTINSYSITEGTIVTGDEEKLNLYATASVTKTTAVGRYDLTIESSNANYDVESEESYYNIYYRSVTIKPTTQTFTYGNDISLNQKAYVIENIANNEDFTVALNTLANSTNNVGNYEITSSYTSDSVTKNYSITCGKGTLTIEARKIEIIAQTQSFEYGENIELEQSKYSVSPEDGVVNGDIISVKLTPTANIGDSVGKNYFINVSATQTGNNYEITETAGMLEITQRNITITIEDQESVFGKDIELNQLMYKVTSEKGIYNNDNLNIELIPDATSSSPVGEYDIDLTYDNDNYNIERIKGTLYIKGREVVITLEKQEFTYGDNIELDYTLVSSDEDISALNIVLTTTADNKSSVGQYEIKATTADANVKLTYDGENKLIINKRDLQIDIFDQTCIYGEVNLNPEECEIGTTVNGDVINITLVPSADNNSPVGDNYNITAITENENYNLIYENAKLTIIKKQLTIYLENQTCTYGSINLKQTEQEGAFTLSEQPYNNDDLQIEILTEETNKSNIGENYIIYFEFDNGNYEITGDNATLIIEKREIEIEINQTVEYGNSFILNPSDYRVVSTVGVANEDDLGLRLVSNFEAGQDKGEYSIEVVADNANYIVTVKSATIEITQKPITINLGNNTSVYGDTVDVSNTPYTQSEPFIEGDEVTLNIFSTADNKTNVGNAYVIEGECSGADVGNYAITINNGILEITPRKITLEAEDQQGIYGASVNLPALYKVTSERKIVNNDEALLNIKAETDANSLSPVGTYTIWLTYTENSNYEITIVNGEFKITEGDIIVTISTQTFYYGEEIKLEQLAFETNVEIDKASLLVTLSTKENSESDVGNHYIINGTSANANYKVVFISGTLIINKRPMQITLQNQTKTYGDVIPDQDKYTLTDTLTGSIVTNDTVGITLASLATNESDANKTYPISFNCSNTNYSVTPTNSATLSVVKRPVTIKTIYTGTYGASFDFTDVHYSVTSGSIVNNDDLLLSLSTNAQKYSPVGKYNIIMVSDNSNYNVKLDENSYFEIVPRDITISIEKEIYYGDAIDLTNVKYIVISGSVVNNDSLNLKLSTNALNQSTVGTYSITIDEANSNYNVALNSGKLIINKRILFIEAVKSGEYGNYFNLNNLYNIVEGSIAFDTDVLNIKFETDATIVSPVGNYNLTMSYKNDNYDIELKSTSYFEVLPRKLYIKIGDQSSEYGNEISLNQDNYHISSGSIVNEDVVNVSLITTATKTSNVGAYIIDGRIDNTNYNAIFTNGTYTISKRKITIKLDNQKIARGITFELDQNAWELVEGELVEGEVLDVEIYSKAKMFSMMGNYKLKARVDDPNYEVTVIEGNLFLNISFIDVAVILIVAGIIAVIVVKVVKHKKAKKDNQKLFDKWIKW